MSARYVPAVIALAFVACANAQQFPTKAVRVIVSDSPGGAGCDFIMRAIGPRLAERTGQAFVVENRPGGSGQIGLQLLAQAPTDGHTIGCGRGGNMIIVPLAYKTVPYDSFRDFAPIALLTSNYLALAVHPSLPFKTTRELITYARSHPGKLSFGTNGEGDFLHFATELFRKNAGFSYLHVPFKSAFLNDLVGGHIDAAMSTFGGILPYALSGRLRLLGIAREKRAPDYPEYPTLGETVPGYTAGGWFGAIAPAGVPRRTIEILNREINAVMQTPDVREKAAKLGLDTYSEPPEYFAETMRKDFEKWGKLVREIGFTPR